MYYVEINLRRGIGRSDSKNIGRGLNLKLFSLAVFQQILLLFEGSKNRNCSIDIRIIILINIC